MFDWNQIPKHKCDEGINAVGLITTFKNDEAENLIIDSFCFDLGAFGNVKYAELKKDKDKKVAIKAMKKKEIIDSKHVDHIENEKKILELLRHPFIVSLFISYQPLSFQI